MPSVLLLLMFVIVYSFVLAVLLLKVTESWHLPPTNLRALAQHRKAGAYHLHLDAEAHEERRVA